MSEKTTRPRIELPERLWKVIKSTAPWEGVEKDDLVACILSNWLRNHATYRRNGEKSEVETVNLEGPPRTDLEGTVRPGIELPEKLWKRTKSIARLNEIPPRQLVANILLEWVRGHITFKLDGKEVELTDIEGGETR